jgi:hypothetical protein
MTRYTVTWQDDAEAELTELWLSAPDRSEITAAVQAVDDALSIDAESKGNRVAEGLMSFNAPPIRVLFVVREPDRVAEVQLVRRV